MTDPARAPKKAHIVSHTHWDREWYLTYHTFRVNFLRIVKRILCALETEPQFRHFLLDGQAAILEDYLEVHPEDAQRIRGHVEEGRLSLGPWYILPDEFLISAESHVRNLYYGHKVALENGGVQKVGYMPDSFGHIAQIPQLLRQAGIDSFVYTRGNGDELERTGFEYNWQAPDGSEVLAINQCKGYCNAGGLGFKEIWHAHTRREVSLERAVEQITELFAEYAKRTNCDTALINNGCDHFPPQQEFAQVLAALKQAFPDTAFEHTDLKSFMDAIRAEGRDLPVHSGELLGGRAHFILSGVWSARMYLKQLNDEAQSWLTAFAEPLSAYTRFVHGADYPSGLIEYCWKLLLKNHPHDSICGCSIDEVHVEMLPRFAGVIETAEQECVRRMEALAHTFARKEEDDRDTLLAVFNPLPHRRDAVIRRLVVLQPYDYDLDAMRLLDEQDSEVEFTILKQWYVERFWGVDYRMMLDSDEQRDKLAVYFDSFRDRILKSEQERDSSDLFLLIEFTARDLPGLGHANYRLTDRHTGAPAESADAAPVSVSGNVLENDLVLAELKPDGSLNLTCKQTGRVFSGLNLLESTEDVGDEYDYSPSEFSSTYTSAGLKGAVKQLSSGPARGALETRFEFPLPVAIGEGREGRDAELVACPVSVRLTLDAGSPVVDVELEFDNRARDHRLRALFPADLQAEALASHGHFFINQRPLDPPADDGWAQPHPGTYPQQDFSCLEDGTSGLAVFNRGLPEVAPLKGEDGKAGLALTLLRAVGWLSRDDFPTRNRANAGPTLATPDAQCPGPQRFRYAVMPYSGSWRDGDVLRCNACWRTPPLVIQGVEDQSVPGAGLIEIEGPAEVTAIKRCESRDTLLVRLYNPLTKPVEARLALGKDVAGAWLTDLLEERTGEAPKVEGREVRLELGPHRIATVEIELA